MHIWDIRWDCPTRVRIIPSIHLSTTLHKHFFHSTWVRPSEMVLADWWIQIFSAKTQQSDWWLRERFSQRQKLKALAKWALVKRDNYWLASWLVKEVAWEFQPMTLKRNKQNAVVTKEKSLFYWKRNDITSLICTMINWSTALSLFSRP